MRRPLGWTSALCVCIGLFGCDVFKTSVPPTAGSGVTGHDPYQAEKSGGVRLSLQSFNGCALLPWGELAGKGNANIPYPDECEPFFSFDGTKLPAGKPIPLLVGTRYFLNQFTLVDSVFERHKDYADTRTPLEWIQTQTRFARLDWSGSSVVWDEWYPDYLRPYAMTRRVRYGNARWMGSKDDTFLLEVIDSEGKVRTTASYPRSKFAAENWTGGHTTFAWIVGQVAPPKSRLDTEFTPVPDLPVGFPGKLPFLHTTVARLDAVNQSDPWNDFLLDPSLSGDGAIRVTWSLLPAEPVYFPVTFLKKEELPATCWSATDSTTRVPCGFGSKGQARFVAPRNGRFYQPGEDLEFELSFTDFDGNLLHPPDRIFSYEEALTNRANGLLVFPPLLNLRVVEADNGTVVSMAGPIQDMRLDYTPVHFAKDWWEPGRLYLPTQAAFDGPSGLSADSLVVPGPRRFSLRLPTSAKSGTYVVYVKSNRYWMGERNARIDAFNVQVGQEEPTNFPNRVGNCQICHWGPTSLSNMRHGLSSDHVEGCKTCHGGMELPMFVHQIHMLSPKYKESKQDCAVCHRSRESALRPSLDVCNSCHQSAHGDLFFAEQHRAVNTPPPNSASKCAEACHESNPPSAHRLPSINGVAR